MKQHHYKNINFHIKRNFLDHHVQIAPKRSFKTLLQLWFLFRTGQALHCNVLEGKFIN